MSRPSTGTILGIVALFVALGGTAAATTSTLVNIADPVSPTHKARVDATGALRTSEPLPARTFLGHAYLSKSATNTLIGANHATVALTRLDLANYFDQTNRATVDVRLFEQSGDTTVCNGSSGSKSVGTYEVPAGQTVSIAMQSPIVLKPLVTNDVWCLLASVAVQGGPGSYFLPEASYNGYVAVGALPDGAIPAAPGSKPRRATR